MTKLKAVLFLLLLSLVIPSVSCGREISPFVSTDWLEQNLNMPGLLIVDVREKMEFEPGHIPNAVNISINSWAVERDGLVRELPSENELIELLGSIGVRGDSKIVVVGRGVSDFDRADAVRVAWTILLAGIKNSSVLDGGFSKWLNENRQVTDRRTPLQPTEYKGKVDKSLIAFKEYVLEKIAKSVIVDNRTPELYFGMSIEPWALKPGHIKGAVNLPTPWAFKEDGLLRSIGELRSMAYGVIGRDKSQEIITYCGAGPYATVWSYILTELLGYKDVKVYDGSMQEWIMDPAGPVELHKWN